MSEIEVAAVMCDSEYGCGDTEVTWTKDAECPADWGIETRGVATEHLCWGCVYDANENEDHYLRTESAEVSR